MQTTFCSMWDVPAECENPEKTWLQKRKELLTASDVATALGHNSYKSPIELWEEKRGLREPKDLSQNEAVLYGKQNEPRIRAEFTESNAAWCSVDYHQYGIFVSRYEPWLGATLDGEIVVTDDENPYSEQGLKEGMHGVLEIKTGGFFSEHDLEERWAQCPLTYVEQVRVQMFVTHADFAILKAELRYKGDDPDLEGKIVKRQFLFLPRIADENLIVDGCKKFWKHVTEGTCPTTEIKTRQSAATPNDDLLSITLTASATVGEFMDNFDAVEGAIRRMVEKYDGLVFTESDVKDAKAIRADLNTKVKDIQKTRIAVKKQYCAPLLEFEDRAKKLEGIITDAAKPIDAQIKFFEENEKEEKRAKVIELIEQITSENLTAEQKSVCDDHGFIPFDDRWLNKSKSMKAIRAEVEEIVDRFASNLGLIARHSEGDDALNAAMMDSFMSYHDIGKSFEAEDRYKAAKKLAEERAEREEALKAERAEREARRLAEEAEREKKPKPIFTPLADPTPAPVTDENVLREAPAPKLITFTFEASHTSVDEWKALTAYMKAHGFAYRKLS